MWRGVTLHIYCRELLFTFDVERSNFTFDVESLFTFDALHISNGEESLYTCYVERSYSSLLIWRVVTSCGEESLFTYYLERSHSSHLEESLLTFCVERSHSSHFMWRGVTLFTFDVERSHSSHLMWRGITLLI
jgi:hypothetical protein